MHWMIAGWESGYWTKDSQHASWIPDAYKLLSKPECIELNAKVLGELQCARDAETIRPKTHYFWSIKESAHRANQQAKEKHTISCSIEQLHKLIVTANQTSVEQANVAGGSKAGMESVHTPWLKHLIKSFITENLSNHSKGKDTAANQSKSHDSQQEQVLKPKGDSNRSSR